MTQLKNRILGMKLEQYVSFSIAIVLIYTIGEFISGCYGMNHDILTGCVYGFFGGEVVSCAFIKVFKIKREQ